LIVAASVGLEDVNEGTTVVTEVAVTEVVVFPETACKVIGAPLLDTITGPAALPLIEAKEPLSVFTEGKELLKVLGETSINIGVVEVPKVGKATG